MTLKIQKFVYALGPLFLAGLMALVFMFLELPLPAQTINGLMTGVVTDSSGAILPGAEVTILNQGTGQVRTGATGDNGVYLFPQLPPAIYSVSVSRQGFATEKRNDVQLEVNQSATLDFTLKVSGTEQTIIITGAAPLLNTTSATLSDVISHEDTVDLPLNGREFTQLALLTPGVAPLGGTQQGSAFNVSLGAGGISPAVNGQRATQNNFTMDGVLNNSNWTSVWAIAPPPDAIQEFDVQSHITDAQFGFSSGANINVVTRSGTNTLHGTLWEFLRNDAVDAQTFPQTARLPYRQNQYGVYFGGPVIVPHIINGKDNTWFSFYWEGYRYSKSVATLASTLTANMVNGDFSGVLGTKIIGTDSLGRPEYANEIYDPETSRPDPAHPGEYLRDPFLGNMIPPGRINSASTTILKRFYPAPNLPVADGVLPNYTFSAVNAIASDNFGARLDRQLTAKDAVFARFNRSKARSDASQALPTVILNVINYYQQAVVGYTHLLDAKTILNFRYGYTYNNELRGFAPAGTAFADSINFTQALPAEVPGRQLGPAISIANGYGGVSDLYNTWGPGETMDYHLDLTKIAGHHTLGVGAMYDHVHVYTNNYSATVLFTQNGTGQDGLSGPTGYGPASFMLGVPDEYEPTAGNSGLNQVVNWYGLYAQDQWQVTKDLVLLAGLRWDYVAPPGFDKIVSGLDVFTGQFAITRPYLPLFPQAVGSKNYFYAHPLGFEPRFGFSYSASQRTVIHGAFAILDDHNNTVIQLNQNMRISWPTCVSANFTSLDLGLPSYFVNSLPAPSTYLSATAPYAAGSADPHDKIPYTMEYNLGLQRQLSNSLAAKIDYVGSLSRHQYINPTGNMALYPGPGPVSARQPYPQYGGPSSYYENAASGNYNALQAQMQKSLSSGLLFMASYTWSKSMDIASDPYASTIENIYALGKEYAPSSYSLKHMFVFSGVYALPVGSGKKFLTTSNSFIQALAGNWSMGAIATLHSGLPFNALAGSDIANVGTGGAQRGQRNPAVGPYATNQSPKAWLNPAAFTVPASYTYGNEARNDLFGPAYRDIDFNAMKDFSLTESAKLQFRAESFNIFNTTNYSTPNNSVSSSSFGKITSAFGLGRELQFALKVLF
jgi:hypothetical protein